MLRIILVDSNVLFREGLTNLLQREAGISVVAEAGSIHEAYEPIKTTHPNLALVDADLPDIDAFRGIRLLHDLEPLMRIVVLSSSDSPDLLLHAVRNGARGFLPKHHSLSKFMASIHAIQRGEAVIPRSMIGPLLDELERGQKPVAAEESSMLTPREMDVLVEIGCGHTNRQISEHLSIAENTVKVHVHNILEKLSLRNRRQAARFARMQGILSPTRAHAQKKNGTSPAAPAQVRVVRDPVSTER